MRPAAAAVIEGRGEVQNERHTVTDGRRGSQRLRVDQRRCEQIFLAFRAVLLFSVFTRSANLPLHAFDL